VILSFVQVLLWHFILIYLCRVAEEQIFYISRSGDSLAELAVETSFTVYLSIAHHSRSRQLPPK